MSNVFQTSVGRKLIISVSGTFLLLFVSLHLAINILSVFSQEAFNEAAHFMATNPFIKVMEPILAIGFLVHIIWALRLAITNYKARPVRYARNNAIYSSSWASRSMVLLGSLILAFLLIHLLNFYVKIKMGIPEHPEPISVNGTEMHNTWALLYAAFVTSPIWYIYDALYVISSILLGLHISHGLWSAFQTLGSGNIWKKRWEILALIVGWIIAIGYSIIPIAFIISHTSKLGTGQFMY